MKKMHNIAVVTLLGLAFTTSASAGSGGDNGGSNSGSSCNCSGGLTGLKLSDTLGTGETKYFDTQVMQNEGFTTKALKADGFSKSTATKGYELKFSYGTLDATTAGKVTFTYLGSDAGYTNSFIFKDSDKDKSADVFTNHGGTTLGSSFSETVNKGALNFSFDTLNPKYTVSNNSPVTGSTTYGANEGVFGIVQGGSKGIELNGKTYQDLLIYNDPVKLGDHDYNDLVVGVNFTSAQCLPVPEPETYALLLAGLGLIGFTVYRRKNDSSNMLMAA
jgi:hypothetical protein